MTVTPRREQAVNGRLKVVDPVMEDGVADDAKGRVEKA